MLLEMDVPERVVVLMAEFPVRKQIAAKQPTRLRLTNVYYQHYLFTLYFVCADSITKGYDT